MPNNTSFSLKCDLIIHVFGVLNDSQDLIGFASRKWYVRLTSFTVQNQLSMISAAFVCYDIAYLVKTILFHVNSFNCLTCEKEKHNCRLKYTRISNGLFGGKFSMQISIGNKNHSSMWREYYSCANVTSLFSFFITWAFFFLNFYVFTVIKIHQKRE